MTASLIVAGDAAERLKSWGLQATASPPTGVHQRFRNPVELPAEVCAFIPTLVNATFDGSQRDLPPLNRNLALYATTTVLRKLGLYDGSVVEVRQCHEGAAGLSRPETPSADRKCAVDVPQLCASICWCARFCTRGAAPRVICCPGEQLSLGDTGEAGCTYICHSPAAEPWNFPER